MDNVRNILVVINRSTTSGYVLDKAATIAASSPDGARVHIVRVIHENLVDYPQLDPHQAQTLKLHLMEAEEEFLVDLIDDHRNAFAALDSATLWSKRVSDAVVDVTAEFEADLIIKAIDGDSPHLLSHPDDWNLLRHARCPVMLVREQPWVRDPVILAAVNATDSEHRTLAKRVLNAGDRLARSLKGRLHVVSALPSVAPWGAGPNVVIDFEKLRTDLEAEVRLTVQQDADAAAISFETLHLHEGIPVEVVADCVRATRAELVVMGTRARTGLRALVMGNTSEKLLNTISSDVLVIHA